jgi:hypothetical protein
MEVHAIVKAYIIPGLTTPSINQVFFSSQKDKGSATTEGPNVSHIDAFFARFLEFNYDKNKPAADEYQRLRKRRNKKLLREFREAFRKEFNLSFHNAEKHLDWKSLCEVIECTLKELEDRVGIAWLKKGLELIIGLQTVHVNIYDVLHRKRTLEKNPNTEAVVKFETIGELALYSARESKIYPLSLAQGGALAVMLRRFSAKSSEDPNDPRNRARKRKEEKAGKGNDGQQKDNQENGAQKGGKGD